MTFFPCQVGKAGGGAGAGTAGGAGGGGVCKSKVVGGEADDVPCLEGCAFIRVQLLQCVWSQIVDIENVWKIVDVVSYIV